MASSVNNENIEPEKPKRGRPKGSKNKTQKSKAKPKRSEEREGYKARAELARQYGLKNVPSTSGVWAVGVDLEDGDNSKMTRMVAEIAMLPPCDVFNVEDVALHVREYFRIYAEYDMKPTVSGLANCIKKNRRWLYAVVHDEKGIDRASENLPNECREILKSAYNTVGELWEIYMNSGKINPASGIFLGKNNFQYRDVVENVITPNTPSYKDYSEDEIRTRYT